MKTNLLFLPTLVLASLLSACGGSSNDSSGGSVSSLASSASSLNLASSISSSSPASSGIDASMASSSRSSNLTGSTPGSSSASTSSSLTVTPANISLTWIGRYSTGEFDVSAAEIPAFDPASKRAFIVNAQQGAVDVLDMSTPAAPVKIGTLDAQDIAPGSVVNSVAVYQGIVALAIEAAKKTDPGFVGFYRADNLSKISHVSIGAQPDMLAFTPDGKMVLVANEGEPSDDYGIDPEGSISLITLTNLEAPSVVTAGFHAFNGKEAELRTSGVRIYGPAASAAQDFEPEYIAVAADSSSAWIVLQENNALAKLDIATATITDVLPLGFKDQGIAGNGMDTSDSDGIIAIKTWPGVRGLYLPDAIAAYEFGGDTYLVTANEGDARAWGEDNDNYWAGDATQGFVEEFRVKHLVHTGGFSRRAGDDLPPQLGSLGAGALLNPEVFGYCGAMAGDPLACRNDDVLGRLNITWTMGYRTDESGAPMMFNSSGIADETGNRLMYDALYAYGARSFSIWNEKGELIWDSADQIEQYLASEACKLGKARNISCADFFNSGHDEGSALDSRSDAKGPEPEGLTLGKLGEKTFAFIGLERMGGILVYDITQPQAPIFVDYLNTREDWLTEDPATVLANAGDLGPEGLLFISASDSPNGKPMLLVGNEVSGTTSVYEIEQIFATE